MNHKSNSNTSAGFMDPVLDLRAVRAAAAKECVEFSNWNNNRNKPGKKIENMKTHIHFNTFNIADVLYWDADILLGREDF